MINEAEEWIRDNHINGDANIGRQFIGYDGQPEVCYDPLSTILEAYAKHYVLEMLKDETDEKISKELKESGVDTDNMIGSIYKLGILYFRDKLIKQIEDE